MVSGKVAAASELGRVGAAGVLPQDAAATGLDQTAGYRRREHVDNAGSAGRGNCGHGGDLEQRSAARRESWVRDARLERWAGGAVGQRNEAGIELEVAVHAGGDTGGEIDGEALWRLAADGTALDHRDRRHRPALDADGIQAADAAGRAGCGVHRVVDDLAHALQALEARRRRRQLPPVLEILLPRLLDLAAASRGQKEAEAHPHAVWFQAVLQGCSILAAVGLPAPARPVNAQRAQGGAATTGIIGISRAVLSFSTGRKRALCQGVYRPQSCSDWSAPRLVLGSGTAKQFRHLPDHHWRIERFANHRCRGELLRYQ